MAWSKVAESKLDCSIVTKIEVLGFVEISTKEKKWLNGFFRTINIIGLSEKIAATAIDIRQQKRVKTPDAIIAATALENDSELWTVNERDFKGIEGLKVVNPLKLAR